MKETRARVTIMADIDVTPYDLGRLRTLKEYIEKTLDTIYVTVSYKIDDVKEEK